MSSTADRIRVHDPTVYPVEERVGEDIVQRWIVELFRPLVERWLAERGELAFVGADQFIYYKQFDPFKRVAPDVYVLPGVDPQTHVASWKIFETGIAPSFALEVASKDWEKDYIDAPAAYGEMGVREVIVFDPGYEASPERFRFQIFRETGKRGLVRIQVTNEDRVQSKELGCWVRSVGVDRLTRLRLATGKNGDDLLPTEAERERAEKEHERAEKERERAEKEAALARIAELERELAVQRRATKRGKR